MLKSLKKNCFQTIGTRSKKSPLTTEIYWVIGQGNRVNHTTGAKILGDIVISMEKAVEQADRYGHSLEREVGYLAAHSMLHLLGYDHEDGGIQKVHMREKEEQVMTQLGLPSTSSYVLDEDEE